MKETMEQPTSPEQRIAQGKPGPEFLAELEANPNMADVAEAFRHVLKLAEEVESRGGALMVVGGSVRDEVLGLPQEDFDVEIYHLPPDEIEELAHQHGAVKETGKQFAVLKLHVGRSDIDIAPPRRDSKIAPGHKGFKITADPSLPLKAAAGRRDFTINALAKNPLTGEIIDYFGGLDDAEHKILRAVDAQTFIEDPLRALRAVQFVSRFDITVEQKTFDLLKSMRPALAELPRERLFGEWKKLWLTGRRPSAGLELARQIGLFEHYPEIQKMAETAQDPEYHPEGDVWTHTKLVVDQAADLVNQHTLPDEERLPVMLAAFGHDMGKAMTTEKIDGHVTSYGHEMTGLPVIQKWLNEQGFSESVVSQVVPLVREHMNPTALYNTDQHQGVNDGAIRRLANRLHPATIQQLMIVCEADHAGRGGQPSEFLAGRWLLERAAKLNIQDKKPPALLEGQDLIDRGWQPGTKFGAAKRAAEDLAELGLTRPEILSIIESADSLDDAIEKLNTAKKI